MKKFISVLCALLISGSAISAYAQKLTPRTTYYNYAKKKIESTYTTLPDGTMHGVCKIYHKSTGKIGLTSNWDKGILTHLVIHYEDGSPKEKHVLKLRNSDSQKYYQSVDYTSYDIYGKVDKRYTMRPVAGSTTLIKDRGEDAGRIFKGYILATYSDKDVKYTLSADNKKAEIKYTKGNHFVYDFEKEILTIKAADFSYGWDDLKFTYKNNIATINSIDTYRDYKFLRIGQSIYDMSNGISTTIPALTLPLKKSDFFEKILFYDSEWYSSGNQLFCWFGIRNYAPNTILMSNDFTSHIDDFYRGSILIFANINMLLKLTSGDRQNGTWEYTNEDGSVSASVISENGEFNHITYRYTKKNINYTGGIKTNTTDSDLSYSWYEEEKDINGPRYELNGDGVLETEEEGRKTGKFENGDFVSGTVEFNNSKHYNAKCLKYTIADKQIVPNSIHIEKENGEQFVGNISIPYHYTTNTITGTYTSAKGNKYTGEFSNDRKSDNSFRTNTITFYDPNTDKFNYKGMSKGKADITTNRGKYVGDYRTGEAEGLGLFTDNEGNTFEGQFSNNYVSKFDTIITHYKFPSGEVYDGEMIKGKFNGKGKLTMPNGDFYEGAFKDSKFLGNGTVRVTTNKGVYEGPVTDFKSPDNSTKIKAPKLPKFNLEYIAVGIPED